mmetsp:Transcript_886/g.2735  ORF Transcript_886/g.2735 Transcript_886/m.2735 type:complete len:208 (+) Transcript_886:825-1448(+)
MVREDRRGSAECWRRWRDERSTVADCSSGTLSAYLCSARAHCLKYTQWNLVYRVTASRRFRRERRFHYMQETARMRSEPRRGAAPTTIQTTTMTIKMSVPPPPSARLARLRRRTSHLTPSEGLVHMKPHFVSSSRFRFARPKSLLDVASNRHAASCSTALPVQEKLASRAPPHTHRTQVYSSSTVQNSSARTWARAKKHYEASFSPP